MRRHQPVMPVEVLELLEITAGVTVIDGTIGHGGHAELMLRAAGDTGRLIGFDWDKEMLAIAEQNLSNVSGEKTFVHADYRAIPAWLSERKFAAPDAVLLDFGVNMQHFSDPERGFSFQFDAPLDMRMDSTTKETAAAWLNRASEGEIKRSLSEYGGERHAGIIAREVVKRRKDGKMRRTLDLVAAIEAAVPPRLREKRIHPATRTFQAIRIQINRELDDLESTLVEIGKCLKDGGVMATLSYHSGEDRAAKFAFKSLEKEHGFSVITKKPLEPKPSEISTNPSSRSAKLRAIKNSRNEK